MSDPALEDDPVGATARALAPGVMPATAEDLFRRAPQDPEAARRFVLFANAAAARRETGPGLRPDCEICGRDSCAGCGGQPQQAPAFVPAIEMLSAPVGELLVEDMARPGWKVVIVGESGAGKSFVVLSLAVAISDEQGRWFGRAVKHGSVAYVMFEGDALRLRLEAQQGQGARLENLYVLRAAWPISPRVLRDGIEEPGPGELLVTQALERLAAELRDRRRPPIVAVIVDTVRASLSGSEDNSEHVAAYLRAVGRILAVIPGAAAYLVHHTGWQDSEQKKKRERGSSAFRGNVDATLYLEVSEDDPENHRAYLELRTLKVRDAERPAPLRLVRQRVDVMALDGNGQPLSSCVILADPRRREDREAAAAEAARSEDQAFDLKTLRAIADRPELATSQDRVRELLGVGKAIASASIARLIRSGWILPGRRGEPYTLTPEGARIAKDQGAKP